MKKKILYVVLGILFILLVSLIVFKNTFKIYSNFKDDEKIYIDAIKKNEKWYSVRKTIFNSSDDVKENIDDYSVEYLYIDEDKFYLCKVSSDKCDTYNYEIQENDIVLYDDTGAIDDIMVYMFEDKIHVSRYDKDESKGYSITLFVNNNVG